MSWYYSASFQIVGESWRSEKTAFILEDSLYYSKISIYHGYIFIRSLTHFECLCLCNVWIFCLFPWNFFCASSSKGSKYWLISFISVNELNHLVFEKKVLPHQKTMYENDASTHSFYMFTFIKRGNLVIFGPE